MALRILPAAVLGLLIGFSLMLGLSDASDAAVGVSKSVVPTQLEVRESHARELMGKYYRRSLVSKVDRTEKEIRSYLLDTVESSLPKKFRSQSKRLVQALQTEAKRHGFDPLFLVAVIRTESSFRPDSRGGDGEIGLMQILPKTAEWIARQNGIRWKGDKTLLDPVANIRIGAAYFAWLRTRFDSHSRLYLAAYNMGAGNVNRALDRNVWPKDYPARVMQHYVEAYGELRDAGLAPQRAPSSKLLN